MLGHLKKLYFKSHQCPINGTELLMGNEYFYQS